MNQENSKLIPINVFTGYLGSGKTTIILNLLKQLPSNSNIALLKNEFGNIAVDSELAKESNIEVKEFINGCLCCVLVGKLGNAIEELVKQYQPERIIIETSGSAYPAPIVWEIQKTDGVELDSVITVIDAINFSGYRDKSYTAKLQAQYTDLILINKHESVSERELDVLLDDVYELNSETPKIRTKNGVVDPGLIFNLQEKDLDQWKSREQRETNAEHNHEADRIEINTSKIYDLQSITDILDKLSPADFYRIKGIIKTNDGYYLLNYVFGKYNYQKLSKYVGKTKLLFIGRDFRSSLSRLIGALGLSATEYTVDYMHEAH